MNNQYELELAEQDIEDWYVDQSPMDGNIVSSFYTSYGIRKIDSQYCQLIQNIDNKIKQVYRIVRKQSQCCDIKTREIKDLSYYTWYEPIELSEHNGHGEIRIEWETGHQYDFYYGTTPVFDIKLGNINPEQLKKDIKECPNLHVMIKENLLLNLEIYTK